MLICGGGSGHEPGLTGFVSRGLLSTSVCANASGLWGDEGVAE